MTTLAVDVVRNQELGDVGEYSVIASDIIYGMAAVGLVAASGHARPLVAGDRFVGFAESRCDNSTGAAAAKRVRVAQKGKVQLAVTGALITDIGCPVYATDDDTFALTPVGGSFVGLIDRFISSGVVSVKFDTNNIKDPYAEWPIREELTGTKTFDAQDCGKAFFVTDAGDGDALTLPAIADGLHDILVVAIGAYGSTGIVISPAAADNIRAADLTAVDDKDLLLTKATQRRHDSARISLGDADGYSASLGNVVHGTASVWTKE